jgi:hypothetical protein
MATPTTPTTPPPPSVTPPSGTSGTSWRNAGTADPANIYANMVTNTNTKYLTQTSQPDITSLVNATMQQLVGRNATPQEIQQYGQELLAAEKANQGTYAGLTQYGPTGKRSDVTGTQTTTGVDAQAFLSSLIKGTGEAKGYNVMNTYMGTLQQMTDQFKGSFNG